MLYEFLDFDVVFADVLNELVLGLCYYCCGVVNSSKVFVCLVFCDWKIQELFFLTNR
jgi:hypothetical protein